MRSVRKSIFLAAYYLVYSFVYAGWWFHDCREPVMHRYSIKYIVFLLAMAVFFLLPPLYLLLERVFGAKRIRFTVTACGMTLLALYIVLAEGFYSTRQHRFDPFVQIAPPRFDPPPPEAEEAVYRVLVLGGSTTKCGELPADKRYPRVLATTLRKRYPANRIDVFSGAAEWYTTRHSLINYTTYYREYRPNLLVVMHAINDVCRSFSPAGFAIGPYDDLYGHFYGPAIQGANPPTFIQYLAGRCFYDPIDSWYSMLRYRQRDYPVQRYVSLKAFEKNLRHLVEFARNDHVKVVLVTQPSLYYDGMSQKERAVLRFGKDLCSTPKPFFCRDYPAPESLAHAMADFNAVTRRLGACEGVFLADVETRVAKNLQNFLDDVHYTEQGARTVAETVAETIADANLIGP